MKNKREQLFGVPPAEAPRSAGDYFHIYKSPKKDQNSFRITKALLDTVLKTGNQLGKVPRLIITIIDGDKYIIDCTITKIKN